MKNADGPADTVMMGVMHDALRRDFSRTREILAGPVALSQQQASALAKHIKFMLVFLEEHHHNEDEKLWPLVLTHDPSLGPLMDAMSQDHAAIAAEVERLDDTARRFGQEPGEAARVDLVVAIDGLTAVLAPHLDREESELMPRVSACLTATHWREFEKSAKPDLSVPVLAEYLNWFLEDLDPVRRHKVVSSMPAPIVLISTRVFGHGYRRRAAERWAGAGRAHGKRVVPLGRRTAR